ncbi:MAG: formylglycine-generating enzyme family protein [Rhodospirillales bacterium]
MQRTRTFAAAVVFAALAAAAAAVLWTGPAGAQEYHGGDGTRPYPGCLKGIVTRDPPREYNFPPAGMVQPGAAAADDMVLMPGADAPVLITPGAVFKDCGDCPDMTAVPAGSFVMGLGAKGTSRAVKRAQPPVETKITKPFAIGRFEVTFDNWQACLDDGGCRKDPHDHCWGRGRRPVVNIDLLRVENYLKWLRKKTGRVYRLPSEAEWEYAARAGTETDWWWGDKDYIGKANCKNCKTPWSRYFTAPTGSFGPNPFGLYDTSGNVYEWTADCWNPHHRGRPRDQSVWKRGDCGQKTIRGGSFYYVSNVAKSYYRSRNANNLKSYWLGFRVVRELE